MYYHGSTVRITSFNTSQVFLAKNISEARRYGGIVHKVCFSGKPVFKTPTILVVNSNQINQIDIVEDNPTAVVYRT